MSAAETPPARRGSDRTDETRAAIISAVGELFATRGYTQTSMRDIGREGPVSMGAVYLHFKNKAELLAATLNDKMDHLDPPGSARDGGDHVERLTNAALDYPRRRQLRALLVQAAAAAQTDDEAQASVREAQESQLDQWIVAYEAHREQLRFDDELDIPAAVRYMWAAELGLGMYEALGMELASPEAWADIQNRVARSLRLSADEP